MGASASSTVHEKIALYTVLPFLFIMLVLLLIWIFNLRKEGILCIMYELIFSLFSNADQSYARKYSKQGENAKLSFAVAKIVFSNAF